MFSRHVILMQRSRVKRRRSSVDSRQRSSAQSRSLDALCRRELVALVSELRAQNNPSTEASINNSAAGTTPIEDIAPPRPDRVPCLFIDKPVRSGQIIEFPAGDVTVIGSVGSGAEINAGGSIHVYGTLGRALAGPREIAQPAFSAAAFMPSLWPSMAITVWRTTWIQAYGVAQFKLGLRACE